MQKRRKIPQAKLIFLIIALLIFSIFYSNLSTNKFKNNRTTNLPQTVLLGNLAAQPVVNNVTGNSQYFKNGNLIQLWVECDQENYTLTANFSTIDNQYKSNDEFVIDYKNGTYLINYSLSLLNNRTDGTYQIVINATNTTSGLSTLYNDTHLTLDNRIPNLFTSSPDFGAFLSTNNLTITGFMNATGSKFKQISINDTRFEYLNNLTGKSAGNFLIVNKSTIPEGSLSIRLTAIDSVNLANSTNLTFILDNTLPNLTGNVFTQVGDSVAIQGEAFGTFSPIKNFQYNMTEFSTIQDPTGKVSGSYFLANQIANPIADGNYTLNVTIQDSVNFTKSHFIKFTVDLTPPFYESIIKNISEPEYYDDVKITINNPQDSVSGIQNIFFYYSITDGLSWIMEDITQTHFGIIPQFPYNTHVQYRINITDNYGNLNTSPLFSYTVEDNVPPIVDVIQRAPTNPTQRTDVNISVAGIKDGSAGVSSLFLNYSLDEGRTWIFKNITTTKWGIIEARPAKSRIYYQIIVNDTAGNRYTSELMSYVVSYNPTRLIIILVIIGAAAIISTYSVREVTLRRRYKGLRLDFINKKEEFKTYVELRIADIKILINDINIIGKNLEILLSYQWAPKTKGSKDDQTYSYQRIMEFVGISQISTELSNIKNDFDRKRQKLEKNFHQFKPRSQLSQFVIEFDMNLSTATLALERLSKLFRKKYLHAQAEPKPPKKVKYPLEAFDGILAKNLNEFRKKYQNFATEFDQLLNSRKVETIESRFREIEKIFDGSTGWLKKAKKWSKTLPLPKDRGYKYLLKLKSEQYYSVKSDLELKIEKLRAKLTSSITFAQDFINWNFNNLKNRLIKFEKVIYEDALRFISSEKTDISKLEQFIKEKFDQFIDMVELDKAKVIEFYETHKEFKIHELFDDWNKFIGILPSKLDKIQKDVHKFIKPLQRLFRLIEGVTDNFYDQSLAEIRKYQKIPTESLEIGEKVSPLKILFSNTVWKINRIDNDITSWINLLPFDLETPQLIILLGKWNDTKDDILDQVNALSEDQKVFRCEIMNEILDPLNDDVWECSNCGAISCMEHLERWYRRKKAPECFKCGKSNTFKLKAFPE